MDISFIIPCYGSEKTIETVCEGIKETLSQRPELSYEIILVNDCSPDNVMEKIRNLAETNLNIKAIRFTKNFGQHCALMAGFRASEGEIMVCLDDDGQTPAEECFKLIDKINEGYDAVFASYSSKKHSLFRNLGSLANDFMARTLIGKPKELQIMSYFACNRIVADEIIKYENPYPYLQGLVLRSTKNITNVEINHKERLSGRSGYTFKKLIDLWLNGFTAFSVKPLRMATLAGFITGATGFLYMVYIILRKLFFDRGAPLGYSSLLAVVLFIGGMLMVMVGLAGEYIGRMYISINASPQYVIGEKINIDR